MDEKLRHYTGQLNPLILEDGIRVSCGRIGDVLADVTGIAGEARRKIKTNQTKKIEKKP